MNQPLDAAIAQFDALISAPALPQAPATPITAPLSPLAAMRSFSPPPTPDQVAVFCRQYANHILLGVPESHPSVMAYACFKRLYNDRTPRPWLQKVRNSLSVGASAAKLRLTPQRQLEYDRRAGLRALYADMAPHALAEMITASAPADMTATEAAARETADQRRDRLMAHPPAHPSMVIFEEDSAARLARRIHKREYADWCQWRLQEQRALSSRAQQLGVAPATPAHMANSLSARGAARATMPWAQRRMEDLATIVALGRPVPRAQRHPLGHVLLALRPHRENRQ